MTLSNGDEEEACFPGDGTPLLGKDKDKDGGKGNSTNSGGGSLSVDTDDDDGPPCPHPRPKFLSLDFDRIVNSYSNAAVRARNESRRIKSSSHDVSSSSLLSSFHRTLSGLHNGNNNAYQTKKDRRHVISDFGFTLTRWGLTFMVGLCTGLSAVIIIWSVDKFVDVRVSWLNRQVQWATGHADADEIRTWYHRVGPFDSVGSHLNLVGVYVCYSAYNLLLVLTSSALCVFLSPEAAGSGIPEVKAYLNGIRVGLFDDVHLFWTKCVGTIFSVSSGLVIGPEGPVVHLGAIIGSLVTKTGDLELCTRNFRIRHPTLGRVLGCADRRGIDVLRVPEGEGGEDGEGWKDELPDDDGGDVGRHQRKCCGKCPRCPRCDNGVLSSLFFYLSHFRNDLERRHLISVGAAAGFASAFGAPVGGLLYSMEEASSFFAHDMLWRTLFGTAVATSCIAVYHGDFTRYSMLSLEIGDVSRGGESLLARFTEVPLYLVMGALGGLLGTIFNNTYEFMNRTRKRFYDSISKFRGRYLFCKMFECAIISVITSMVMLTIPLRATWACRPVGDVDMDMVDESEEEKMLDPGFMHRYNCPEGEINEIGSILFGSREESIKDILTNPAEFEPNTLLAVGLTFLLLMMVTFGIAIPQGMFMPTVLTGASLGGYAGLLFKENVGIASVHPADFAIIGAAAFLAGMQRNTVSLCVILMEGTGQTKIIIPVIITVVSARFVGDFLSEGIYEIGMELKHYPYLLHRDRKRYDAFPASRIMQTDVDTIGLVETAYAVESLLLQSAHHAFPVVDEEGEYRGMVRRDQLIAALQCKIYVETIAGIGIDETERSSVSGGKKNVTFHDSREHEHDDDGDDDGGGTFDRISHRRYSSARNLPRIDDGTYTSQRQLHRRKGGRRKKEWDPNKPEFVSPWLRDNVLTSDVGDEIMFGMDETLPNGRIETGGTTNNKAVVRILDDKYVVFVPPEDKDMHVDVGCIMNRAALSVPSDFPLSKTYDLFVSMGLRHLPVLGKAKKVVGMITRYNLLEEYVEERTGYKLY